MATRKTANDVDTSLKIHEKMCEERWKTIYKKTDSLQESVDSMKIWLLGGLTTIVASLITLIIKTSI
jgi:adenosyl cobinamide kinase/adenosyl cobinamide phosphate guanylyltransferase